MNRPFAELSPARSAADAEWVVEALNDRVGITGIIPLGFEAYARVLHHRPESDPWYIAAPEYLGPGRDAVPRPSRMTTGMIGDMGAEMVEALLPHLRAATSTPEFCHYGLWHGWGDLRPGTSAVPLVRLNPDVSAFGRWM